MGVLYGNAANNASDMIVDIHSTGAITAANIFSGAAVIQTALTLGDRLSDMKAIAMHSKIYGQALNNDEIQFFKPSDNSLDIPTYKGMCVIVDDNLTTATAGVYVTILFGPGAIGYAVAPPRTGYGTELWRVPSAGNGGGLTELHSRFDVAFPHIGRRRMRLNGKRISPDGAHKRSVLLAIEDVTERHEQAEARYQRMFEMAKDGMMICDVDTEKTIDVNPFLLEFLGVQRDQVIGRRLGDLEAFQTARDAATMVAEAAAKEVVRRDVLSLRGANGRSIEADFLANLYVLGSRPVVQINLRDVTARNRAVEELRESEARFRLSVESVRDYALFQLDPNGLISSWNIGAGRLLGYTEEEIIGQHFERIFTPLDVVGRSPQTEMENARSSGTSLDERWHVRKDGSLFFANGVLTAIRDSDGRLRGFSKIMRDITDSHRAEIRLEDQEQKLRGSLAEKEALLKEIHHRVKNNLQIIASLLDLQSEFLDQADSKAVLLEMKTRVRSIAAIHELLYSAADFSRIEFRRFVEKLAQDVIAVHRRHATQVEVEIHTESVLLDMTQAVPCGLIVNELLTNALKHAFPEGRSGRIKVAFGSDQANWQLEVTDDGIGLAADIDPGNVNSMGFQLIQLLAQQLGGSLDVVRAAGTRFIINFPRDAWPPPDAQ